MSGRFISTDSLPFCRGCGHALVTAAVEKALCRLNNLNPLDLLVVTDIGCIGIIDRHFKSHTIHGLHGRSVALATGISMGLSNPDKKILVLIGDGGSTIGLQHILEAAHRNINMTVLVHNNMLYGMTGGQPSGLTPCGFRTATMPDGRPDNGIDLCKLVHSAGAAYAKRLYALGDISDSLEEAFRVYGFSLVEAIELCPSYGVKFNPGKRLEDLSEASGLQPAVFRNDSGSPYIPVERTCSESLFKSTPDIAADFGHNLQGSFSLVLAGSAGEGVQSTAELLARAAMACGLWVSKKGSYPVTVGVGFSLSELVISEKEVDYTGISRVDAALVTSRDGIKMILPRLEGMKTGTVFIDTSLDSPSTMANLVTRDYRTPLGPRSACLLSAAHFVSQTGFIPMEAFLETVRTSIADKVADPGKLMNAVAELNQMA
jgi:2-oxoglutarate ferredoxin oxidoreductase subunit beta